MALPKRGQGVRVGIQCRRASIVQRRQPILAEFLHIDRLARHERISGRLLPNLGQRVARQYAQAIGAAARKVPKLISENPMWLEPTRGESRGLTRHPGLHIMKVRRRIHAV